MDKAIFFLSAGILFACMYVVDKRTNERTNEQKEGILDFSYNYFH